MNRRLHFCLHCILVFLIFLTTSAQAQTCSVNAGVNAHVCITGTMTLNGNATGLFSTAAQWALVSGPNVPTITSPTSATTTVTGFVPGTYRFRYYGICSDLIVASDTVEVVVDALPVFTAGTDSFVCGTTRVMNATLPSGATGVWSVVQLPGTTAAVPTFSSNAPNATANSGFTGSCPKNYNAIYTVTQGACVARDTAQISFGGQISTTLSYPDASGICGTTYEWPAIANYFGCGFTFSYVQLAGPSIAVVSSSTSNTDFYPRISNLIVGNYTIALAVTTCSGVTLRDTFNLNVTSTTGVSNTFFNNLNLCPIQFDSVYYLTLSPLFPLLPGETLTYNFSSLTKPAASPTFPTLDTIGNVLRMRNVVHPDTNATELWQYEIFYTVSNGTCSRTSVASLRLNPPISKSFQSIVNLPCGATSGNIARPVSGGLGGYAFTNGTVISKPAGAPDPTFAFTFFPLGYTVSGLVPGKYIISFAYFRGVGSCGLPTAIVEVNVSAAAGASNAGTNQILSCGVDSSVLAGNIPPAGQIGTWQLVSGPSSVVLTNPNSPSLTIKSLSPGKYTFRWSINNGATCPASTDEMQVVVTPTAPTAVAGPDRTVCYGYSTGLTGNSPAFGTTGRWRQIGGPAVTIADTTAANTSIMGTVASTVYTFTWTLNNICGSNTDTVVIATTATQGPSNAQILTADACITTAGFTSTTLNATAPAFGSGLWSQISGPAIATIATPASATTTVSGLGTLGEYKFVWTVTSAGCDTLRDTVSIANRGTTGLTANGGTDKYICTDTVAMTATTPTLGVGTWTQVTGSGSVIDSINSPTTKVRNLAYGSIYDYVWTVNLGVCPAATDTVHVVVSSLPSPAIARTDTFICNNLLAPNFSLTLPLTATSPTVGVGAWSLVVDPYPGSTIANPSLATTTGSFRGGITKVVWQVLSGNCPASRDTVVVEIVPRADAGAATVSLCEQLAYTIQGTSPGNGTSLWSQSSGPTTATITQPNSPFTTLENLSNGTYVFRYNITHPTAGCNSVDSVTINNAILPVANAGRDTIFCYNPSGTALYLQADTPSVGTGIWSRITGTGTVIFSPSSTANPTTANISAAGLGIQQFQWRVTNGACQSVDVKDVMIERLSAPGIVVTPLTACRDTFTVTGSAPLTGLNYSWSFPKARIKDTSGIGLTGPITNNFLISDTNSIYLTITNPASGCTATDSTSVIVDCAYLPLPLNFLSVQSSVKDCAVRLTWEYSLGSGARLKGFEVERSSDGRQYETLSSLPQQQQEYIDVPQFNGTWFYRIKAVGIDNEVAYTSTQAISTQKCIETKVNIYPNPAGEQLNIVLQGNSQNNSYELIDALGRVLLIGNLTVNSNTRVDVTALASGTYTIRIRTDTKVVTEKVQIVK